MRMFAGGGALMIPAGVEVLVGIEPIDLRWGFDRLAGIMTERGVAVNFVRNQWSRAAGRSILLICNVKHGRVEESMRSTVLRAVCAFSASAVLSFGCGSNTPSSANSFTKVYAEVLQPKCTNDFCHFNGVSIRYSALDLSSQVRAYWSLVGLPSMGPACSQIGMRVVPWDPDHSVMYQKLLPSPPCGIQMPADSSHFYTNGTSELKFSGNAISNDERQLIYNWIQEGAQDN